MFLENVCVAEGSLWYANARRDRLSVDKMKIVRKVGEKERVRVCTQELLYTNQKWLPLEHQARR